LRSHPYRSPPQVIGAAVAVVMVERMRLAALVRANIVEDAAEAEARRPADMAE
jgi:hypothetical protein